MVKKKGKTKTGMKKKKNDAVDAEIIEENGETLVSEAVENKEEKTLIWFFVVVGVVFASVLIPY